MSAGVVVGLVHPGSMGSAVGACAAASASVRCVHWASAGRSTATIERAAADGLVDAGTLQELARRCDIIVSVCPPDKAVATAADVMAAGFSGLCVARCDSSCYLPRLFPVCFCSPTSAVVPFIAHPSPL